MERLKLGIVGCGNISEIYHKNLTTVFNDIIEIEAVCDLIEDRYKLKMQNYGIKKGYNSAPKMLAECKLDLLLNITTPDNHAIVNMQALEAGVCPHVEKPFALTREDGQKMLKLAADKGLLIGGAPDTYMGAGFQTCRQVIDSGEIGEIVGATAFLMGRGHEGWHPDPEFYYKKGGGPMFDMGPYYLTALVSMIGPVKRVTGATRISFPERTITSQPKAGQVIKVDVPTYVTGLMDFANGAIGTIITTFDVYRAQLPRIEIYGSKGTLYCPDPNGFGGPVTMYKAGDSEPTEVKLTHGFNTNSRGLGLADMAWALREGRKNRCDAKLAYHILDIMTAFHDSSDTGKHVELQSTCERPAPLPAGIVHRFRS